MKVMKNLVLLPLLLAVAVGCSKSPTEPQAGTPSTPKPPTPVLTYSVNVTASPSQLTVGGVTSSNVSVVVSRSDNGQPPADLTALTLTTSLGEFGSVGSGTKTLNLQLVKGRAQAILFPGTSAGTATISATVAGSTGAANVLIQQTGAFFLSSVSPGVGSPNGGDVVTINGGGFVSPVRVTFGGAPAVVRSVGPNKIVAVVPSAVAAGLPTVQPGQAVPVNVSVTINVNQGAAQLSDSLSNGFLYSLSGGSVQQPAVISVSPTSGPNDGGTTLTIVGQGFQSPVQVLFGSGSDASSFNGVEATVQSATPTQLVVVTPAARGLGQNNVNAVVDILIKNVNTGFFTVSRQAFKYGTNVLITSWAPGIATYNIPETVTIFGQGFEQPAAVSLAGIAAGVTNVTSTEIIVKSGTFTPSGCQDLTGPISVTNINTGNSDSRGTFTYKVPHPQILSLSPRTLPKSGGQVVIMGTDFGDGPGTRVTFGGQAAAVVPSGTTMTQLTVQVPPFAGTFPTGPCPSGAPGTQEVDQTVDVVVVTPSTTCTDTFPKSFTYTGNGICVPPPATAPVASFSAASVPPAHTIQFTDTSTGSPTSWLWDFGDLTPTSTLRNPVHTFAAAGSYMVTLRATNSGGSGTVTVTLAVP